MKTLVFALLSVASLSAQTPSPSMIARLVARSGTVEIQRGTVWALVNPNDQIKTGERVRTGERSSAAVELGPGKIITLSEQTEVEVREKDGTPFVQLQAGNLKVVSIENLQVATKETVLETTERPVDLELGYQADRLNLTVITGAVRNGPIIIKSAESPSKRTFTAGGRWGVEGNAVVYPGFYFYPYVVYTNNPNGAVPGPPQGRIVPPTVLNPTHPAYRPDQIVPPMTDPLRPPNLPFR